MPEEPFFCSTKFNSVQGFFIEYGIGASAMYCIHTTEKHHKTQINKLK